MFGINFYIVRAKLFSNSSNTEFETNLKAGGEENFHCYIYPKQSDAIRNKLLYTADNIAILLNYIYIERHAKFF